MLANKLPLNARGQLPLVQIGTKDYEVQYALLLKIRTCICRKVTCKRGGGWGRMHGSTLNQCEANRVACSLVLFQTRAAC
eukprot:387588-Pelagomonas_calceolata.AAC.9